MCYMCARVQRRLQHEMCALKWVTFSSHNRPQKQKQRIDRALTESLIFPIWWFPFHAKVPEVSHGFEWICTLCTHRLNRSVCLNRNWTLSSDFRHFDLASDSIFAHIYSHIRCGALEWSAKAQKLRQRGCRFIWVWDWFEIRESKHILVSDTCLLQCLARCTRVEFRRKLMNSFRRVHI